MSGFDFFAVDTDVPELDEALNGAAGHRGITAAEVRIEALIRKGLLDGEALAASRLTGDSSPYLLAHQLF
jgi:hypothetical protein